MLENSFYVRNGKLNIKHDYINRSIKFKFSCNIYGSRGTESVVTIL